MTQSKYNKIAWGLFGLSVSIAVFAWANAIDWRIFNVSLYEWFPLFGLVAWMTMATHYYTGALRIKNPELKKPKYYKRVTGYTVLASILLHPGILAIEQFRNGAGLPPASFLDYVKPSLAPSVVMGSVALLVFLSFEVFERIRNKPMINKYWYLISLSQSYAMILIFLHGLSLGGTLDQTWFRIIWIIYGLALLPCFYLIHLYELKNREKTAKAEIQNK